MFRDLKEYQEIQSIYEKSVCISDEERQLLKYLEEQDFTEEELLTLSENTEEVVRVVVEELLAEEEVLQEQNISKEELVEGLLGVTAKAAGKLIPKAAAGLKRTFSNPALRKGVKGVVKGSKQAIKNTAKKVKAGLGALAKGGKDKAAAASSAIKDKSKAVASSPIVKGVGKVLKSTVPLAAAGGVGGFVGAKMAGAGNKKTESGTPEKTTEKNTEKITGDKGGASTGGGGTTGAGTQGGSSSSTGGGSTGGGSTGGSSPKPEKKMGAIEKKNRERFGNKRIDFLKQKQKDFKSMDRAKFREKYPNSQSAKNANRKKSPMDMRNESTYDPIKNYHLANDLAKVYQKIYEPAEEKVDSTDAENYNALVEFIIKENIVSTVEEADTIIAELDNELVESYLTEGVITEGLMDAVNRVKQGASNVVKKVSSAAGGAVNKAKEVAGNVKDKVQTAIQTKVQQGRDIATGGTDKLKQGNQLRDKMNQKRETLKTQSSGGSGTGSGMSNDPGKTRAQLLALKNKRQQMNNPNQKQLSGAERAKQMAKERLAAKNESVEKDAYTVVLEYLLSSQQAATIEEANYIMTELDTETIQGIISES